MWPKINEKVGNSTSYKMYILLYFLLNNKFFKDKFLLLVIMKKLFFFQCPIPVSKSKLFSLHYWHQLGFTFQGFTIYVYFFCSLTKRQKNTLPCCDLGAQIPPPLIFDFSFFSTSSHNGGALTVRGPNWTSFLNLRGKLNSN